MTRLIDADDLKKAFKKSPFVNEVYLYYARQLINLAPTVEERPHGECRNCTHYNLFGIDENTTYCDHPALYCDDPFCGVALATKPQDTCSYFTHKGGDEK